MPHFNIYGKIVFKETPDNNSVLDLAYFLFSRTIEYRIGINIWCNLSESVRNKFNISKCIAEKYIPFEILDNPATNECYHIFDGIWIGKNDYIGIENSKLPSLEKFLSEILNYDNILYIALNFNDVHGDENARATTHKIHPDELCKTIEKAPRIHTELPNLELVITI